jgi:ElaB/YqjD/DUF883 family membrane-anchored ribosome-binding protein
MATRNRSRFRRNNLLDLDNLLDGVKDRIYNIQESLKDEVVDRYNNLESDVASYTKSNPFKTIGISVLAGLVASRCLHRCFCFRKK